VKRPAEKKILLRLLLFVGFRGYSNEEETVSSWKPDPTGKTTAQRVSDIWDQYHDMMFRTARANTNNIPDAEDAVQNVFLSFMKDGVPDEAYENLGGYVHRVVMNECRNLHRSNQRRRIDHHIDVLKLEIPSSQRIDHEMSRALKRAKAALRDDEREILDLFHEQGRSLSEIAEIRKTTEGQVKMKLSRAREKISKLMGYFEDENGGRDERRA
jgi:RNA polymerase sigma-70 factor (ECF subfamily)